MRREGAAVRRPGPHESLPVPFARIWAFQWARAPCSLVSLSWMVGSLRAQTAQAQASEDVPLAAGHRATKTYAASGAAAPRVGRDCRATQEHTNAARVPNTQPVIIKGSCDTKPRLLETVPMAVR